MWKFVEVSVKEQYNENMRYLISTWTESVILKCYDKKKQEAQ